jgi:hypothetical protein
VKAITDSQKLDAILDELRALRELLELLLARREESRARPEPARADNPVDAEYFARVSGLSPITIKQGKAGTSDVPLFSMRPRRWLKGDVDRWVRERAARLRSPRQQARRLLDRKRK